MARGVALLVLSGVASVAAATGAGPCCQGKCKEPGMEKYWSIAKSMFGTPHCGESCMNPKDYKLYHFFEANLTLSKESNQYPCKSFGYTKYDSTPTHGFGPVKMTLDLYDLPKVEAEPTTPCCQGKCKEPGMEKYWSIAKSLFGTPHCGESCMNPKDYKLYHFFEANLTKSELGEYSPCVSFGYTKYDSTPTHGFGPVKMTLDLYDLPKVEAEPTTPCCQGKCKEPGMEKYWSIAKSLLGTKHCGESCMNPKDYKLYHFFEANLTKSKESNQYPCKSFGYTKYDSTPTHGFGPVKMTLDLYDLPSISSEIVV